MKLRAVAVILALAFGTAAAGAASATVVTIAPYSLSDTSFGTGLGVHSNGTQTGMTIDAHVNQDGSAVTFSSTDVLSVTGSGEATFNGPFHNLDVSFAKSWSSITFAFDAGDAAADMAIAINGSPVFNASNCSICTLSANGEQKFTVTGPAIDELDFSFTNDAGGNQDIDNAKQFRVEGPVTPGVPEPATWALMILGVGLTGFAARRRSSPALAA